WAAAAGDTRGARWQAALYTALALATRETMFILPAAIFLQGWLRSGEWRAVWRTGWPALLVVGAAALAFLFEAHHRRLLDGALGARDLATQLQLQLEAWRWFAGQILLLSWPNIDPGFRLPQSAAEQWRAALTGVAIVAAVLAALRAVFRRRPTGQ